ncbi:MAG: sortase [Eubacteriales bacterium]|nr:sortase [Eubacteriales bacterium]
MRKFGIVCLVLGVLMFLSAGIWLFYNEQEDERAGRVAQSALTQLLEDIGIVEAGGTPLTGDASPAVVTDAAPLATSGIAAEVAGDAQGVAAETTDETTIEAAGETTADTTDDMPGFTIDGHTYIGYVTIPEIGLALPVQKDYSFDLLDTSPVRYLGSLQEGNMIVAGHNFKTHFSPLKNVSLGSQVTFTDVNGNEYFFIVSKIQTVGGSDYSGMLADADQWDLTLFTCTPGGKSRLTLRCVETGRQTAKALK